MGSKTTAIWVVLGCLAAQGAWARTGASKDGHKSMTLEEALAEAEKNLDIGAVGDAAQIAARVHRTRGLSKDEQRKLDLIDARCGLVKGDYAASEKLLSKLHKGAPDDARITEWYARALDGEGKGDSALPLLAGLAAADGLKEGDSYWALAQLERKNGQSADALKHAKLALERPIVLQSEELDKEIHKFIDELSKKGK
jgi:hypothetical protein